MAEEKVPDFDVVIVGSGISGMLIAKVLGEAEKKLKKKIRVLVLEAGEELPSDINGYMSTFLRATAKVPESPYPPALFSTDPLTKKVVLTDPKTINAGRPNTLTLNAHIPGQKNFGDWKDPTQSYLIQNGPLAFASTYERINGGTVRHWLGTSLRFVPADFEMKKRYDKFVDWPIKYDDLEPFYCDAEREIGVSANVDDQEYLDIKFSTKYPMPGIPLSKVDLAVDAAMPNLKIPGIGLDDLKWKVSGTPAARNSQPYQERRVCAGNTNCIPICPIGAKYDPSVTMQDALRTGNVKIRYRHVASHVDLDGNGKVTGIQYLKYDTDTGSKVERGRVTGKIYILAGHAIETPRLLLMSTNGGRAPNGIANSKGFIGKFLMDHPLYLAWALMPTPVWGYRGPLATAGIEVCRDGNFRRDRGAFRVEIGNEGWNFAKGDPDTTTIDFVNGQNISALNKDEHALYGTELVRALNDKLTRQFRLGFLIEQSPDDTNTVTLSKQYQDHLGLPRPQINYDLSDYTRQGLIAAKTAASAIFKSMNAEEFTTPPAIDDPTSFEHEVSPGVTERIKYYGAGHVVGTYRMGDQASNSAVDGFGKSWDHGNLYMVGSGTFPTVATANPTLTIAALALRTADHLVNKVL
jgi:choline dehydrogenase-like flavoprotein